MACQILSINQVRINLSKHIVQWLDINQTLVKKKSGYLLSMEIRLGLTSIVAICLING